jgi:hypothetical protein
MSASTQTAPRQLSFGRFPSTLAALALVVILAVAVAIVALNGTKATPATSGAKGAPPPAVIDHGSRDEMLKAFPAVQPFIDHGSRDELSGAAGKNGAGYGGWNGPRTAPVYKDNSKDDQYTVGRMPYTGGAPHGMGLRPQ